jgi:DNA-binding NtrC family response regulator
MTDRRGPTEIIRYDDARRALVTRRARLVVLPPSGAATEVDLPDGDLVVGSDRSCGLVLADRYVSGRHARITLGGGEVVIEDLGSTNGTRVGGAAVSRAVLVPGGEVVLGRTRLRLDVRERVSPIGKALPRERAGILGDSPAMRDVLILLFKVAPSELPVLIMGETGTGKELAARFLHSLSRRATGPFLAINCSAVSRELFESELFGHEKGAFTSATGARVGLIELARGGTLFLDEVGEMPPELQPKLLRALEERTVRRVGGNREIATDVRIVAATNRDLGGQVAAGAFRRDLFYRLAAVPVALPPLRERERDVLLLAREFLAAESAKREDRPPFVLDTGAEEPLLAHGWPGNVRELRNLIAAACQLAEHPPRIGVRDLRFVPVAADPTAPRSLDVVEADAIREALARAAGNAKRAAATLGLPLSTFYDRMKRHGIRARESKRS